MGDMEDITLVENVGWCPSPWDNPEASRQGADEILVAALAPVDADAARRDLDRDPDRPVPEDHHPVDEIERIFDPWRVFRDTTSGEPIDPQEAHAAMREEERYMRGLPVWEDLAREDLMPGDRPVPCKWVFKRGPPVRARAVVCEVKAFAPHASEFAATPPLGSPPGAHFHGGVRLRPIPRLH